MDWRLALIHLSFSYMAGMYLQVEMVTKVSLKRYTMSMEKNTHVQNRNRCTLAREENVCIVYKSTIVLHSSRRLRKDCSIVILKLRDHGENYFRVRNRVTCLYRVNWIRLYFVVYGKTNRWNCTHQGDCNRAKHIMTRQSRCMETILFRFFNLKEDKMRSDNIT